MKKIWLNQSLVPVEKAKVSVLDRGFIYGDGVYEAVRVYQGKIFRPDEHWKRLDGSLKSIHMKIPWSHKFLTEVCRKTAEANGLKEALVRVTISRGAGELGYDPSTAKHPTLTGVATPIRQDLPRLWEKGVKAAIVHVRRNHVKSLSPAIKHTNSLNGILAKIEALKSNAFEGIFLNLDGYLAEGTISNIFMVKHGVIKTPSLSCGILDGVTRHAIIELSKKFGVRLMETEIEEKEIFSADEVFLTSTTMEAMPVVKVNNKIIRDGRPGPVTKILQKGFRSLVAGELNLRV